MTRKVDFEVGIAIAKNEEPNMEVPFPDPPLLYITFF
jgi:hypothetical protein